MADAPIPLPSPSSESTHSSLKPRPLNFSRPRPISVDSKQKIYHDRRDSAVKGVNALHDASRATELPGEPRFSSESQRTETEASTPSTTNSAASEFAWDGQLGELRSKRRPDEYERNQRFARSPHSRSMTSNSQSSSSTVAGSEEALLPPIAELPGSAGGALQAQQPSQPGQRPRAAPPPPIPTKMPKIVKRTSVDQQSERMSVASSQGDWEDDASHHTMSVDGDAGYRGGGVSDEGNWSSSTHDTSGLSQAEIQKLRKKGINPALYAEMKAARKGKGKWIGPLVGNTYIG